LRSRKEIDEMASLAMILPLLPGKTEAWKQWTQDLEAEDIAYAFGGLATSQDPFDVLFRQRTQEFFGFDLAQPPQGPLPETVFDWRAG